MVRSALAVVAGGALAAGSQGAFISFASDSNPAAPTFSATYDGASQTTTINEFAGTTVDLLIDPDHDGPLGPITVAASFTTAMELAFAGTVAIVPGVFSHNFSVAGFFEFREVGSGDLLFRGDFDSAAFAGIGNAMRVFSGSMSGFEVDYTVGSAGSQYTGDSGQFPGDFGFTFTNLNSFLGAALVFDGQNVVGISDFTSEGSFSGSYIPAPGSAMAMGLMGLAGLRRRR